MMRLFLAFVITGFLRGGNAGRGTDGLAFIIDIVVFLLVFGSLGIVF